MKAIGCPAAHADKITWITDDPVWVDQWPLMKEKLQAAEQLVQERLQASHIVPNNSPWNTPIFVIKKKSGRWRLLQDLRAVNQTMGSPGTLTARASLTHCYPPWSLQNCHRPKRLFLYHLAPSR